MKRFLSIIVIIMTISLIFSGCTQRKNTSSSQVEHYIELEEGTLTEPVNPSERLFGIRLKPQQSSYPLDTKWLTFEVMNQYESDFGTHYSEMDLEVQTEGGWRRIVHDTYWGPDWILKGKSSQEFQISLRDWKYSFTPDHYRLVMHVSTTYPSSWFAAEFDLTESEGEPLPKSDAMLDNASDLKLADGLLSAYQKTNDLQIEAAQSSYSLQDPSWQFTLYNRTEDKLSFAPASNIFLNIQVNGEWYFEPAGLSECIAHAVTPKSSTSIEVSPNLKAEHYRIVFIDNSRERRWTSLEFDPIA